MNLKLVRIKIRRLDVNVPDQILTFELDPLIDYNELKQKILNLLDITDEKVFKVRNSDDVLVPLTAILEQSPADKLFTLDVTNVHHDVPAIRCTSPLHSVYESALKLKLLNMESRVSRIESFVPQLKQRRQSILERTTHSLGSRVSFLDRRIDELTPVQWLEYMQMQNSTVVT